jgi:hypothetical protein
MTTTKENTWIEVRLYYEEPWEEFLIKIIKPYCDTVLGSGAAERYFYIRYWERGAHIRLRFYGETQTLENILKPNIESHFSNFFSRKPSNRREPNYPKNVNPDTVWQANNSIQFVDYEPETSRYAGAYGMVIAEKHFFHSSETVLESMTNIGLKNWSYEQALGVAIKLHLSFVHAVGFDIFTAKNFFKEVFYHWLPLSIQRERITQAQQVQQNETIINTFEQSFLEQGESLLSYHAAFWGVLLEDVGFEEDYLNEWHATCRFSKQEFMLADAQSLLEERPVKYQIDFQTTLEERDYLLWEIYSDFFHLTNNRLGISNHDESYLAYLMMRSMEKLVAE